MLHAIVVLKRKIAHFPLRLTRLKNRKEQNSNGKKCKESPEHSTFLSSKLKMMCCGFGLAMLNKFKPQIPATGFAIG
jgi:hypothetical protein